MGQYGPQRGIKPSAMAASFKSGMTVTSVPTCFIGFTETATNTILYLDRSGFYWCFSCFVSLPPCQETLFRCWQHNLPLFSHQLLLENKLCQSFSRFNMTPSQKEPHFSFAVWPCDLLPAAPQPVWVQDTRLRSPLHPLLLVAPEDRILME